MDSGRAGEIKKAVEELEELGRKLYARLCIEESKVPHGAGKDFADFCKDVKVFNSDYERFYTVALSLIRAVAPERLADFIAQYKDDKRRKVDVSTYLISDAIVGYRSTHGHYDRSSAIPRLYTQISIINAINSKLKSALSNLDALLRFDLLDGEITSARHLASRGHLRAAGAVAGVVLEKHLASVAQVKGFTTLKKNASIADYNEHLKASAVIDLVIWRRIQGLADIRNLCDHAKGREPSVDEVNDLINGTERLLKSLN